MRNDETLTYRFGSFRYRADSGELSGAQGDRLLRPQLARLLEYLLEHPGQVLDRDSVARAVWGDGRVVEFEAGLAALIKELRSALADSASTPRYLETIPRRGLRWLVTPEREAGAAGAQAVARPRRLAVGAAVGVILAALFGLLLLAGQLTGDEEEGEHQARLPRVAVLPFLSVDEADREQRASLLLADSAIAALASVAVPPPDEEVATSHPPFAVIGRTSIGGYPGGDELALALARDLRADLVVEGSYRSEGDAWLINVSVVKVGEQTILLSRTFLVSELSSRVAREHLQGFAIEMAEAVRRCGEECLVPSGL